MDGDLPAGTALFCVFASFITGPWLPRAGKAVFDRQRAATLAAKPVPTAVAAFGADINVTEESLE